jgi:flavin-dependent dehydrogenase
VRVALAHARQQGPWLSVGPIRPGIRVGPGRAGGGPADRDGQVFLVGNAAGESHPLIGEGIAMALQSAHLLAAHLSGQRPETLDFTRTWELNRRYAGAWRAAFAPRIRFAAAVAHAAMEPRLASLSHALVRRWPGLFTRAARWAGKTRHYTVGSEEMIRHEHA